MKRFLAVAVFVAVVVSSPNVHAQQDTRTPGVGPYVGGHLGLNIADAEINGGALSADHDPLLGLGGVLGYDFGMFRLDGEIAFRFNTADRLDGLSLNPQSLGSNNSTTFAFSYMLNGYFDLPTEGPLSLYIGGGIGMATVSIDWKAPGFFPFSHVPVADDSDSGLAYQFSGGIGYEINPRTTLTFSMRHFATEELQMTFDGASPVNPGSPFTMEYQSNEFNVGARILFH